MFKFLTSPCIYPESGIGGLKRKILNIFPYAFLPLIFHPFRREGKPFSIFVFFPFSPFIPKDPNLASIVYF